MSPEELVEDLHQCYSVFDKIIYENGLEKIKTIGDSYMAAGGLSGDGAEHALQAVHAALEIRNFFIKRQEEKKQQGLPYYQLRIGIHTGPLVAGVVGFRKFQYDIWGDSVNTASRMESSGEPGRINISEQTKLLVENHFECVFRGELEAKGKGLIRMYFVEEKAGSKFR
jgi:class 3 adenylate cyclase